jgi:hypothetical protein
MIFFDMKCRLSERASARAARREDPPDEAFEAGGVRRDCSLVVVRYDIVQQVLFVVCCLLFRLLIDACACLHSTTSGCDRNQNRRSLICSTIDVLVVGSQEQTPNCSLSLCVVVLVI